MNRVLARWNQIPPVDAAQEILACCGSASWAQGLAARRPFDDEGTLVAVSDEIWNALTPQDWMEAFSRHPRIGERNAPAGTGERSAAWSAQEQEGVEDAEQGVRVALAEGNREYERLFGRVFIVCATGKSAAELVEILWRRLRNDNATELREAAEEQRKITNVRLKKWLEL